jgi:hypothetical protein
MSTDDPEAGRESTPKAGPIQIDGPGLFAKPAELKRLGGSSSDIWNNHIANQAIDTLCSPKSDNGEATAETKSTIVGLAGINPRDEIEGMLAAQLIAGHNAAMECYRRATSSNISPELRHDHLNQAGKLSRTFAMLLDSLNRHRGKGQQKVTVEHVHVHKGGQAIVGNIEAPGGRVRPKLEDQPHARRIQKVHAKTIKNAPLPALQRANEERDDMPIARDGKRPVPAARRTVTRRTERKQERLQARLLHGGSNRPAQEVECAFAIDEKRR